MASSKTPTEQQKSPQQPSAFFWKRMPRPRPSRLNRILFILATAAGIAIWMVALVVLTFIGKHD